MFRKLLHRIISPPATPSLEEQRPRPSAAPLLESGHLETVCGDLRDEALCKGPFDVIVERLTLQLFSDNERPAVIAAVAGRLAPRGIFFSHCHDGRWKPPAEPRHWTAGWFVEHGWPIWSGQRDIAGRAAWLQRSTG